MMAFAASGCGDKDDATVATAPGETKTSTEITGGKVRGNHGATGEKTRSSAASGRRSD